VDVIVDCLLECYCEAADPVRSGGIVCGYVQAVVVKWRRGKVHCRASPAEI
jgi:hypothetical protein